MCIDLYDCFMYVLLLLSFIKNPILIQNRPSFPPQSSFQIITT